MERFLWQAFNDLFHVLLFLFVYFIKMIFICCKLWSMACSHSFLSFQMNSCRGRFYAMPLISPLKCDSVPLFNIFYLYLKYRCISLIPTAFYQQTFYFASPAFNGKFHILCNVQQISNIVSTKRILWCIIYKRCFVLEDTKIYHGIWFVWEHTHTHTQFKMNVNEKNWTI